MIPLSSENHLKANAQLVRNGIEEHNNKNHKSEGGMTPKNLFKWKRLWFFIICRSLDAERVPPLVKNTPQPLIEYSSNPIQNVDVKVIRYKLETIQQYSDIQEWKRSVLGIIPKIEEGVNQVRDKIS